MLTKKQKKTYPPGTFIPAPARIAAILQLCLAFSILLWNIAGPFAGELFEIKSKMLLYQDVQGINSSYEIHSDRLDRLSRNAKRFQTLLEADQSKLETSYQALKDKLGRSFFEKFSDALRILFFEMPIFEKAWLLFSIFISVFLLKRVEGAREAVWLIPLLTFCYIFNNQMYGVSKISKEISLFPSETFLIQKYLNEPLSKNLFDQQAQLKLAWKRYLVDKWGSSSTSLQRENAIEDAEFAFNIARLKNQIIDQERSINVPRKMRREPLFFLSLYLFWNTLFACIAWKYTREKTKNAHCLIHQQVSQNAS